MELPKFFKDLDAKTQKRTVIGLIILGIILIGVIAYQFSDEKNAPKEVTKKKPTKNISLEGDQLEKGLALTIEMKQQQQAKVIEDELANMRKEFTEFKKGFSSKLNPIISDLDKMKEGKLDINSDKIEVKPPVPPKVAKKDPPPPPPPPSNQGQTTFKGPRPPAPETMKQITIGGIDVVRNPIKTGITDEKKNQKKIYLPPSFMRATLLAGVAAPCTTAGKSQPTPTLFKIDNLAILPNSVRADLKGCFVIAEGTGNLATERIKTRLLTLSCITKNGESIIDQEIKGFVVDADGQVGLKGRPVSKMGMHLARVGLAGLLGGGAKGFEESAFSTNYSPATGITERTIKDDTESIIKLGVGQGITETAKELRNFYLELAQQTLVVLEVGPTKKVNLVISNGTDLKLIDNRNVEES